MESVVLDRTVRQELVDPSMVAEITENTGAADEVVRRHYYYYYYVLNS
jgi:hypothetical protein